MTVSARRAAVEGGRPMRSLSTAAVAAAAAVAALAVAPASGGAQDPLRHWTDAIESRVARTQPVVSYVLRVDSTDLTGFDVAIRVRGARDTLLLAMAAHPEYDDRYWRYVRDVRVAPSNGGATIARADSALWRLVAPGGSAIVTYRLQLPPAETGPRRAWQPFLASTGGLVGGMHAFMYVVGETLAPSHVTLELPVGWRIATGLEPTSDPHTFYAPGASVLLESPMLVGRLRDWRFAIDGVPHRIVYWPRPDATPFDSAALVSGIERIARGAVDLFGRAPYREYAFLIRDGALGALEHANSVTLGAPSASLADDVAPTLEEVAHEFFHAWNLMRIRPAESADVSYRTPPRSSGLWFSEGLSMFYADLLLRRAGLHVDQSTRAAHLEWLIARYLSSPGNGRFSPERVSRAEYGGGPEALGDYSASAHLQGELIGAMLDLEVRHATGGRRSMDDVMRLMLERHSGSRGFTGRDVERAVGDVCRCDVGPFFEAHVRGARPIEFDRYLRRVGMRADVAWRTALGDDGLPVADLRAYPYDQDGRGPRIGITDPESAWGRAGLHTGDRILAIDGAAVATAGEARRAIRALRSGDTVRVEVEHAGTRRTATVVMKPFARPSVTLRELPTAGEAERGLRAKWAAGAP